MCIRDRERTAPGPDPIHRLIPSGPRPLVTGPGVEIQVGDRVLVTGAAGFIGSSVTRELVARGAHVVALVEPGGDTTNLDGLEVEVVSGDLRDAPAVAKVAGGCRLAFHVAALYRFWAPDPAAFYDINVTGTRHVLDAVRRAGCERLVYTSTVGTLGLHGASSTAVSYTHLTLPTKR